MSKPRTSRRPSSGATLTTEPAPLTLADKAGARVDARLAVVGAVGMLQERLEAERGLTRAALARRLGVSRAHVSRLLSGPGNWTLDTVGDLLAAMDARLVAVDARPLDEIATPNDVHPWLREETPPLPRVTSRRPFQLPASRVSQVPFARHRAASGAA